MALNEWLVPVLVLAVVAGLLAFRARPGSREQVRPDEPASGPELIRRLEHDLGIALLVESIEGDGPVAITAAMIVGSQRTEVTVTGDTEALAWRALARSAIAWRNEDAMQVRNWPGGG